MHFDLMKPGQIRCHHWYMDRHEMICRKENIARLMDLTVGLQEGQAFRLSNIGVLVGCTSWTGETKGKYQGVLSLLA